MSKTKKILFTVSIILNILLVGVSSGLIYQKNHAPPWQPFQEKLEPGTQKIVENNFNDARAQIRPLLSSMMKERENLINIMNYEPFNEKEFDRTIKNIQAIQKKISDVKAAAMKDLMKEVPSAERAKLTDNLARFFTWDRSKKGETKVKDNVGPAERVP